MACKAPDRIGVIRLRPQSTVGTPATLQEADGVRVLAAPSVEQIGTGMLHELETESPRPGGFDPVLGDYGEAFTLVVPIPVIANGQLSADLPFIRLCRAAGLGVAIATGTATINTLAGICVGATATDNVPLTIEWAQAGGITHRWQDCIGALTDISGDNAGGTLQATFRMICRVTEKVKTGALPTVSYPQQGVPLVGKRSTLTLASTENPTTLYSWTLTTGIETGEAASHLAPDGIGLAAPFQSAEALFAMRTALEADNSKELWDHFFAMSSTGALALRVRGNVPGQDILEIDAPRPFAPPPELGTEATHRTESRDLKLLPTTSANAWTIRLNELAP